MNFTPLRIRAPISTTAPPKPSVQTTFILNAMAEEAEKEGTKLEQILESIYLLFTRVSDIGLAQQRMCTQLELNTQAVDLQTAEQKLMARQIAETGQAVAQFRFNQ